MKLCTACENTENALRVTETRRESGRVSTSSVPPIGFILRDLAARALCHGLPSGQSFLQVLVTFLLDRDTCRVQDTPVFPGYARIR